MYLVHLHVVEKTSNAGQISSGKFTIWIRSGPGTQTMMAEAAAIPKVLNMSGRPSITDQQIESTTPAELSQKTSIWIYEYMNIYIYTYTHQIQDYVGMGQKLSKPWYPGEHQNSWQMNGHPRNNGTPAHWSMAIWESQTSRLEWIQILSWTKAEKFKGFGKWTCFAVCSYDWGGTEQSSFRCSWVISSSSQEFSKPLCKTRGNEAPRHRILLQHSQQVAQRNRPAWDDNNATTFGHHFNDRLLDCCPSFALCFVASKHKKGIVPGEGHDQHQHDHERVVANV